MAIVSAAEYAVANLRSSEMTVARASPRSRSTTSSRSATSWREVRCRRSAPDSSQRCKRGVVTDEPDPRAGKNGRDEVVVGPPLLCELRTSEDDWIQLASEFGCGGVHCDRQIPPRDRADHKQVDVAACRRVAGRERTEDEGDVDGYLDAPQRVPHHVAEPHRLQHEAAHVGEGGMTRGSPVVGTVAMTSALDQAGLLEPCQVPLKLAQVDTGEALQLTLVVLPLGVQHEKAQ